MAHLTELLIEAFIFCVVALGTFVVAREVERVTDQRRRLGGQVAPGHTPSGSVFEKRMTQNRFFRWVQNSTSISDSEARNKLRRELALAGIDHPAAPVWFVITRFSLAIILPAIWLFLQSLSPNPAGGFSVVFWPMVLSGVGLLAPGRFLTNRATARRTQLEFEFPDALDLMVVCVEAGLSLDAAFIRVGQEVHESHPRIAREFGRLSEELRAGKGRAEALRAMADRCGVDAIKSFVALMIQTETLGAGIAQTLRVYSTELRETRFMKAEEKAMRIPVLMTVPLVACILPVIVTAIMLPAIIDVMRTLLPALAGHSGGG